MVGLLIYVGLFFFLWVLLCYLALFSDLASLLVKLVLLVVCVILFEFLSLNGGLCELLISVVIDLVGSVCFYGWLI